MIKRGRAGRHIERPVLVLRVQVSAHGKRKKHHMAMAIMLVSIPIYGIGFAIRLGVIMSGLGSMPHMVRMYMARLKVNPFGHRYD